MEARVEARAEVRRGRGRRRGWRRGRTYDGVDGKPERKITLDELDGWVATDGWDFKSVKTIQT